MPKQIVGRVQPGPALAYDASANYTRLDRVTFEDSVWECVAPTEAGQSPLTNPECWLVISSGATAQEIAAIATEAGQAKTCSLSAEVTAQAARSLAESANSLATAATNAAASAQQTATEASATAASAQTAAAEAAATAANALPKAGGKLTGQLSFAPMNYPIQTEFSENADGPDGYNTWHNALSVRRNNVSYFALGANTYNSANHASIVLYNPENPSQSDRIEIARNTETGSFYGYAPHPRLDTYGNDIVTINALKNHAPKIYAANAEIFVDAVNGNDTADLFTGRGLTADKPFKSLPAAYKWAARYLTVPLNRILFRLLSDITLTEQLVINCINSMNIQISGDVPERKITCKGIGVEVGNLMLSDLHIAGDDTLPSLVWAGGTFGNGYLRLGSLQFSGTVTQGTVKAQWGGAVSAHGPFTGTVNGPRYYGYKGGRILTGNGSQTLIPGTEAGVLDATSIYA